MKPIDDTNTKSLSEQSETSFIENDIDYENLRKRFREVAGRRDNIEEIERQEGRVGALYDEAIDKRLKIFSEGFVDTEIGELYKILQNEYSFKTVTDNFNKISKKRLIDDINNKSTRYGKYYKEFMENWLKPYLLEKYNIKPDRDLDIRVNEKDQISLKNLNRTSQIIVFDFDKGIGLNLSLGQIKPYFGTVNDLRYRYKLNESHINKTRESYENKGYIEDTSDLDSISENQPLLKESVDELKRSNEDLIQAIRDAPPTEEIEMTTLDKRETEQANELNKRKKASKESMNRNWYKFEGEVDETSGKTLREKIRDLFKSRDIKIATIATAITLVLGTIVSTIIGTMKKTITKIIQESGDDKPTTIGKVIRYIAKKLLSMIGTIISFIFSLIKDIVGESTSFLIAIITTAILMYIEIKKRESSNIWKKKDIDYMS